MVEVILDAYQGLLFPMVVWAVFWYLVALLVKRDDFVDIAWGLGFIYIIYWLAHQYRLSGPDALVYIPVVFWGFRLSGYLFWRNVAKPEDYRYAQWRKEWGKHHWWRSFLQIYLLQNVLLLIIALPIIYISAFVPHEFGWWIIPGLLLWAIGMYWEGVSDWQKSNFKMDPLNRGKIMKSGLWAYSRHPNYFGEICIWWGIWIIVGPYGQGWVTIISPIVITFLLLKVSGVPKLEEKKSKIIDYQRYMKDTPAVFPKLSQLKDKKK